MTDRKPSPAARADLEQALDALVAGALAAPDRLPPPDDARLKAVVDGVMERLPPRSGRPRPAPARRRVRLGPGWAGRRMASRLALPAAAGLMLGLVIGPWLSDTVNPAAPPESPALVSLFLSSPAPALEL